MVINNSVTALQVLNRLAFKYKKQKYSNVPEYAIVRTTYSDKTANDLTKCIMDFIVFCGGYAVRINTQGQYREKLQMWTPGSTEKGTADIHACLEGKHLSVEVKIGRDIQSDHQKTTEAKVKASGGLYFIAKNFESFYYWVGIQFPELIKKIGGEA